MITTLAAFKPPSNQQKAEKQRENSIGDILVALERKITKGVLQEYRIPHFSDFQAKFWHGFSS